MVGKPDIVKKLREEEKLGTLESSSQGSHEELEFPEELPKNTSDDITEFFKEEFENMESNVELTQHDSLSEDDSVDGKEILFQSASDLMLYLDKRGKIAKINKAGIAYSGFSEDEVIGQFFWKIPGVFSKRNIPKYLKVFKNTLKGKPTENFLCELHEKSGKKHVMDFSTYPIKENNKVASILVVAKDVTEQKETEDKYRLITEKTSDLITTATFTLNPIFTYVSPSHKKNIGYEADDLIGKPLFDFVHPDDKRKLLSLLKKYLSVKAKKLLTGKEAEVSEMVEIRFRDKSGNWRYMETTANLIGNEMVSVSRDVTDRRKAEESLKISEEGFRILVENIHVGLYYTDVNGNFLYGNNAAAKILGIPREEIIGRNGKYLFDLHFINKKEYLKALKILTLVKLGKKAGPEEFNITRKDGTKKIVEIRTQKVKLHGKNVIFGIVEDLTEIKKQNIKLKKLDKLKSDFLNVTSHELRTPMTAMKGYLQMLMGTKFGKLTDGQVKALDVILRNTNRLDNLVVDILDTSRLESGTMKFMPELVDTKKLMDEVVETMQTTVKEKKIKIISDSEFELPDLTIDKDRIKQVFDNLITNAMKFSPENSEIHLRANIWKDDVLFEVQDFGKGIPKDKKEKIFEVFYQVDSGVDRSFGGTGLGLSISQGIVLGHGGKIWVDSKEGKGSTFKFTIPLKPVSDVEGAFAKLDMFKVKNNDQKQGVENK